MPCADKLSIFRISQKVGILLARDFDVPDIRSSDMLKRTKSFLREHDLYARLGLRCAPKDGVRRDDPDGLYLHVADRSAQIVAKGIDKIFVPEIPGFRYVTARTLPMPSENGRLFMSNIISLEYERN
jgi:hypothetical protein